MLLGCSIETDLDLTTWQQVSYNKITVSNQIQSSVIAAIPGRRRTAQSQWISFNAVCCNHRGHQPDRRGRGGLLPTPEGGISYNCFNCGYRAGWKPGWSITVKFRRLLSWMGMSAVEIGRLRLEALRLREEAGVGETTVETEEPINFEPRELPAGSISYHAVATFARLSDDYQFGVDMTDQVEYLYERGVDMRSYEFFYTDQRDMRMNRRVIIPFFWNDQIVGYTARAIDPDIKPRYHSNQPSDYVFNVNRQLPDARAVIVCEGPFDAISINGVAVLGNRISETQAEIIERLNRDIIVVPDFEPSGRSMIVDAIEYGWEVSFPVWAETCKDINEAVRRYGKLFVLKAILAARERNPLRIRLLERKFLDAKKTR